MPELPEVETTLRGIAPSLCGRTITEVLIRQPALRYPVPKAVSQAEGQSIQRLSRRAKYLSIHLQTGDGLLIHLGMSGSLRIAAADEPSRVHDHFDICLDDGRCLRFHDPRRFGALLWWDAPLEQHPLIRHLGPEPLSDAFDGRYLKRVSHRRRGAVKNFIMDGRVVVGVGNIYASEALHMAGIHPTRPAGRISQARYEGLAHSIREVLERAIRHGGTTLRDFLDSEGNPGYFAQELLVYDREGGDCFRCGATIRRRVIGQRSSYFCPACQR